MSTKDLTSGNPLKLMVLFMIPTFFGKIFQQLYHFTDAIIVSRVIGIKSLAAVGASTALIFLVISFIFDSIQGFTIVTAQKFGAKDYDGVRKSFAASIILAFWLTIILTLISAPFTKNLLTWLRTPSDIIDEAVRYLFIMFAGIFATVFYNLSSNVIRALGNSKIPLQFLIFSVFLNIFFDLLFVVNFRWGVEGAAWATVLSQAIATIFCTIYMFWKFPILHLKRSDFDIKWKFYYEHIRIGIPMGLQMSVLSLGILAIQFVLNSFGSIAIAAYTSAMRVEQLFSQFLLSLGMTVAVFSAQNYGAKKMSRIREGAKASVLLAAIISLVSFVFIKLFGANIISLFMTEPDYEVLRLAQIYLNIIVIFFFFLGLLMIFRNILQGMGEVISPLTSSFAELIARTGFAFIFGHYFGFTGICTASPAAWISGAIVLFICYKLNLYRIVKRRKC